MPSGDAYQGGVFTFFLFALGVDIRIAILVQILICLSRVYFMCHWLGDTLVGTVCGVFMGWLHYQFLLACPWILTILDYWIMIANAWIQILLKREGT